MPQEGRRSHVRPALERWNTRRLRAPIAVILLGTAFLSLAANVRGEEPAKAFFDQLLARRYYDVALDYLDEMEKSPRAPEAFKSEVPLLRARTLFRSSELIPAAAAKEKRLDEASQAYAKFIADAPEHPMAFEARLEMARLLRARAILKTAAAKNAAQADAETLKKDAKELLSRSTAQFTALRDEIRKKLEPLEAKGSGASATLSADEFTARDRLRTQYMIARSDVAEAYEAEADALADDSPERKKLLQQAAEEFKDIATKYSRFDVGVYARVGEGRCQKKLRDFPQAIKIFSEIVERSKVDGGVVRDVAARKLGLTALLEAMECWLDDSQKGYPAAVATATFWLGEMQPSEEKDPQWIQLKYLAALAHKKFADDKKVKEPRSDEARKSLVEARKLAGQVSRLDSPYQTAARQLLAEMGIDAPQATSFAELSKLKTFEAAREAGQEAFATAVELPSRVRILEERLGVEKDEAQLAELRKQFEEAKAGLQNGFQGALDAYRRALQLVAPSTPIEDVNDVRAQVCRCLYQMERFEEASIIGEFVARRFPTDKQAKFCALIALDAIKKLYLAAPAAERDVETQRMMAVAELITKNWPNDDEAAPALRLLITLRIAAKDYEGVATSLAQIPESSPFRAEAESKAGQAFWASYVTRQNELRAAAAGNEVAPDPAAEEVKKRAIDLLQSSLKRFEGAPPSAASLSAAVSLADVYVKSQEPAKAVELLEKPDAGPMALLEKEETKELFDSALIEQTCRVALAAQLALMPTAPDPAAVVEKAQKAMDKLTEVLRKDSGGDDQRVVATYYTLARDLKQQLDLTKDPKLKANLAGAAETFLQGVQSNTKDPTLLRWVAETLYGFGESFDGPGSTADAKRFYTSAEKAFANLLKLDKEQTISLEPEVRVQIRVKLAAAQRELGKYKEALDVLVEILSDPARRNTATFQLEAAQVLAAWGQDPKGKEQYLDQALQGGFPDPQKKTENIVWGLAKLSRLTRQDPRYAQIFFASRYTIAECYYGKAKKGKPDQLKTRMALVKRDLATVYQLYPEMGGPEWYAKFDALLRRAQREMGEAETGLAGLKQTPSAAPKTGS